MSGRAAEHMAADHKIGDWMVDARTVSQEELSLQATPSPAEIFGEIGRILFCCLSLVVAVEIFAHFAGLR